MYIKKQDFFKIIFILWYSSEIFFNTTAKTAVGMDIGLLSESIAVLVLGLFILQIVFLGIQNGDLAGTDCDSCLDA